MSGPGGLQACQCCRLIGTPPSPCVLLTAAVASAQVIECRRILKWTYAYGYYNFEDEDNPQVGGTSNLTR